MNLAVPEAVTIGDSVIFQQVNDEAVLLSLTTQEYYGLNDVGASMWNSLLECGELEAVVKKISSVYDADENVIRQDLHSMVRQLLELDFLKPA